MAVHGEEAYPADDLVSVSARSMGRGLAHAGALEPETVVKHDE